MKLNEWSLDCTACMSTRKKRLAMGGEQGMVLISSLLILASVSLIAFGLAGDATTEVRIAGNRRLHEQVFNLADGATNLGVQVLLDHLYDAVDPQTDYPGEGDVPLIEGELYLRDFGMDANLLADIKGYSGNDNTDANEPADVSFQLSSPTAMVNSDSRLEIDIDRLGAKLLPGSSIEFAAGYEGVGKGAGAGSIAAYYAVGSSANSTSAQSEVVVVYRKVSNVIGGAK